MRCFEMFLRSVLGLLVTANIPPGSPIIATTKMVAIIPPNYRFLQESRDVTFQKTTFFIATAVKISDLL
jgi:hypothetical protein